MASVNKESFLNWLWVQAALCGKANDFNKGRKDAYEEVAMALEELQIDDVED
jgi:hypothetical protein